MYVFLVIFPFIGFILAGGFGNYFGRNGSAYLTTLGLFFTLITAIIGFYEIAICNVTISINLFT
jgi:NADH:ubiquinone oxidoreductase subunit 5 (subunit L)/multisubunit Na+/H+ antiporter MnhA subunit